jgi:hypothetical protein
MAAAVRLLRLAVPEADPAPLDRMLATWPGARRLPTGLEVPLVDLAPEEVLSHCVAERVVVLGSAVVRRSGSRAP